MATLQNNGAIDFNPTSVVGPDATHWGFWDAQNGGNFLQGGPNNTDTPPLVIGQIFRVPISMIVITLLADAAARLSETGARRYLAGMVAAGVWVSVHSSDPGNTGADEITLGGIGRVFVSLTGWTTA